MPMLEDNFFDNSKWPTDSSRVIRPMWMTGLNGSDYEKVSPDNDHP